MSSSLTAGSAGRLAGAPGTVCELLGRGAASTGPPAPAGRYEQSARGYGRGFAEQGYPDGSLVLIALRRPAEIVALTLGAWWAGHQVAYVAESDHGRRDRIALDLGAALQVCDPGDIVDEEHFRHRDVPAVPPENLALPPASWPARCRPSDPALTTWRGFPAVPTGTWSHAELIEAASAPDGDTDNGRDTDDYGRDTANGRDGDVGPDGTLIVPADAPAEQVLRALLRSLLTGAGPAPDGAARHRPGAPR
ncbi:hypothetical protein C6361_24065 [Plantactinospora sp. BC1]|uniref:hypothetical protein n=1 Tax=Plantactinospora sp. BC1 TaxID=2108470 RepID=UPI000D168237|nr:hypothetical protein [Plantactinospora sp. BC1]AVT32041.1 hypothetical protein C6361_24065 [Plantactinospora sp. BC1]